MFSLNDRPEVPLFNRKKRSVSGGSANGLSASYDGGFNRPLLHKYEAAYLPADQVINLLINTSRPALSTLHEQKTTSSSGVRELLIASHP